MGTGPGADRVAPPERTRLCASGKAIAWHRSGAHLTQAQLAGRIGRSTPWLAGVEQGRLYADRLTDLLGIAVTCRTGIQDLLGAPEHGEAFHSATTDAGWLVIQTPPGGHIRVRGVGNTVEVAAGDGPVVALSIDTAVRLVAELRLAIGR